MKIFRSYTEVSACVGQEVAVTDWITITQIRSTCLPTPRATTSGSTWTLERAKAGPWSAHCARVSHAVVDSKFFDQGIAIEGAHAWA